MPGLLGSSRGLFKHPTRPGLVIHPCPECCTNDPCARFVAIFWCCDAETRGWVNVNDPACPTHNPDAYTLPVTVDVSIVYAGPPASCYRTDHTQTSTLADIPSGEAIIPSPRRSLGDAVDGTGCLDQRCPPCPECCGSNGPDVSFGHCGNLPQCCHCGSTYELHISGDYTESRTARVTDPCFAPPTPPTIYGPFPALTASASGQTVIQYGCDKNLQRTRAVLSRSGTYTETVGGVDALTACCDNGGYFRSIVPIVLGSTSEPVSFAVAGSEGCGLTRDAVGMSPGWGWFLGVGLSTDDVLRQCSGRVDFVQDCQQIPGCGVEGIPNEFHAAWSGDTSCFGGTFTISVTEVFRGTIGGLCAFFPGGSCSASPPCDGPTPVPTTYGAIITRTMTYSHAWSIVNRVPCAIDPCNLPAPAQRGVPGIGLARPGGFGLAARSDRGARLVRPPAFDLERFALGG